MKIVVLGAGRRGIRLARHLVEEKKDVVIIDEDIADVDTAMARVDCIAYVGSGTNLEDLSDAGVEDADAFIALTGSDEVNLVSCGLASSEFGVPITIASIRNISYTGYEGVTNSLMGITHIVNPDQEVAEHIYQDIEHGIYSDIISFENSTLVMYNVFVEKDSAYANRLVKNIRKEIDANFIIAALSRGSEALVPSGDTVVLAGDTLSLVAKEESVEKILSTVGKLRSKPKKIVIVGASQIANLLIRLIPSSSRKLVALMDPDPKVCETFARNYPEILVINADITDEGIIAEENLNNYDLLLSLTGNDELNIITASYAKRLGIKNSMALVKVNPNYCRMASHLDIDNVISAQDVTVDSLMRFLHGSNVSSIHSMFDGKIEVFEFIITEATKICSKALKDINMKGKGIIAGVTNKDGKTLIPSGSYTIKNGDTLVVVTERSSGDFIQSLFEDMVEKK